MTIWTATLPTGPSDVDHPLNRPVPPGAIHTYKHAPWTSNVLQFSTGLLLMQEGGNHALKDFKGVGRTLTGYGQALNGLLGTVHYGVKFVHHPSLHNAGGTLAYGLQLAEGTARMFEAELKHPQVTAVSGAFSAGVKAANAGPLSTWPYVLDCLCNVAEWAHGVNGEVAGVVAGLHALTRQWQTRDLASLQRGTGAALVAISVVKNLMLAAALDPKALQQQRYVNALREAWDVVRGDLWEAELAAAKTPAAQEAVVVRLFHHMAGLETDTAPQALAGLLEHAPVLAKKIVESFPRLALDTAGELRRSDPQRFAALGEKYGVSAFGSEGTAPDPQPGSFASALALRAKYGATAFGAPPPGGTHVG